MYLFCGVSNFFRKILSTLQVSYLLEAGCFGYLSLQTHDNLEAMYILCNYSYFLFDSIAIAATITFDNLLLQ
jgi:hypothetical protein